MSFFCSASLSLLFPIYNFMVSYQYHTYLLLLYYHESLCETSENPFALSHPNYFDPKKKTQRHHASGLIQLPE